jgi:hypothetical protein
VENPIFIVTLSRFGEAPLTVWNFQHILFIHVGQLFIGQRFPIGVKERDLFGFGHNLALEGRTIPNLITTRGTVGIMGTR